MDLPLQQTARGVILTVRAVPRAGRSGIAGIRAGALLVRLAAAPVDGAANAELLNVLADALKVPKRQLAVVSGERGRDKRVLIEGASHQAVARALSAILASSCSPTC